MLAELAGEAPRLRSALCPAVPSWLCQPALLLLRFLGWLLAPAQAICVAHAARTCTQPAADGVASQCHPAPLCAPPPKADRLLNAHAAALAAAPPGGQRAALHAEYAAARDAVLGELLQQSLELEDAGEGLHFKLRVAAFGAKQAEGGCAVGLLLGVPLPLLWPGFVFLSLFIHPQTMSRQPTMERLFRAQSLFAPLGPLPSHFYTPLSSSPPPIHNRPSPFQ